MQLKEMTVFGHMNLTDCIDIAPDKRLESTLGRFERSDTI